MLEIIVDRTRCEGFGNCVMAAPETFDLDDDGLVVALRSSADDSGRDELNDAARSCPVNAILIQAP